MGKHAEKSPSGYTGWGRCSGWASNPVGSKDADQGTAAHFLGATCLETGKDPAYFKGMKIRVDDGECAFDRGDGFLVDDEMVKAIEQYINLVKSIPGLRFVEQSLPIEQITGEEGARGTADCVILTDTEIVIIDLKYGKGVQVYADDGQLFFYAHGALEEYGHLGDFKQVRMIISQPRLNWVDEHVLSIEALEEWALNVKPATTVVPGEKQCRWCANKGDCPALRAQVVALFQDISEPKQADNDVLADAMAQADLAEMWAKAVRGEVESRLLHGQSIRGWKLVQGRAGARAWRNDVEVEQILKESMRLPMSEMYDFKLISPTKAEKVLKPKQWERIQEHITQSPGKPSVAAASDKRPAINVANVAEQFDVIN